MVKKKNFELLSVSCVAVSQKENKHCHQQILFTINNMAFKLFLYENDVFYNE